MPIRETSISFPVSRGSGPMIRSSTLVFPREVTKAVATIRGYQIGFVGDDHHVGLLQVELDTTINNNVVIATGRLGCRDWSGNWDDEYNGSINVAVFAEMVAASAPRPRGDLQIADLEMNQATQFFRSAEHLDSANVMPDNSIRLVGGKTTGLRFYIDYDASSGLPPISSLSGELTVRSGGAETALAPLADITPLAASEIDRAQVGHTLNFAIPGAWCRGSVDLELKVFDSASPDQRSAAFRRTLNFVDVNPLRIYGVGINYTGMGLDLAAPSESAFDSTFNFTRKVWPTGEVLASGYTTLEFSQNLAGNAANGCGSGFNALQDELKDIKGDTDDLVYGVLPIGTPLTGVAGCGGGGAGSGVVGAGVTAAHEAGHADGRKHAPCDHPARCDSPQNQDDDYPQYGTYVSDSIGEFGFDPAANRVFDPATREDFMGYSGSDWISPYTYIKLFAKGDPQPNSPAASRRNSLFSSVAPAALQALIPGSRRAEWIRQRIPLIFLSLWIDGDDIRLVPSFTYPAYIRRPGTDTDYEVHLEDEDGKVLACVALQQACAVCGHDCGPMHLQGEVPWEEAAKVLVLRKDGTDLKRWDIEDPPKLSVKLGRPTRAGVPLSWETSGGTDPLTYLVQWQDLDGAWRGVAPRTTDTEMLIPRRFRYAQRDGLKIRVLAVHLLNTASEEIEMKTEGKEPPAIIDVAYVEDESLFRAVARDPLGRALPAENLVWFGEDGGEIARGGDLSLAVTERRGVATVRLDGAGIVAAEGFALLDPDMDDDREICGCRPAGEAAAKVLRNADLI